MCTSRLDFEIIAAEKKSILEQSVGVMSVCLLLFRTSHLAWCARSTSNVHDVQLVGSEVELNRIDRCFCRRALSFTLFFVRSDPI